MATDERDVLEVLKTEQEFISKGRYIHMDLATGLPGSLFQDSPTCLNFGDRNRSHPCSECLLTALVPKERLDEKIPCHHIPLNAEGETIDVLERQGTREATEEKVKAWLSSMIKILEGARGQKASPPGSSSSSPLS